VSSWRSPSDWKIYDLGHDTVVTPAMDPSAADARAGDRSSAPGLDTTILE
jgi:hypothetical protein